MAKTKSIPPLEAVPDKNVFVMMRYRSTDQFRAIELRITRTLLKHGLYARFAKDLQMEQWLWANIKRYMNACKYGIAVFDSLNRGTAEPKLNPNICTELGYMLAQAKECLILKDKKLRLQTDLQGFIFESFDGDQLESLERRLDVWAEQQIKVLPLFQGFASLVPGSKIAKRLSEQTQEKLAIAKYVAETIIAKSEARSIILDSGTSAAAVAEALFLIRDRFSALDIYTNNVLASVLLCSVKQFRCQLMPGVVDQDFAGVFGSAAVDAITGVRADVTIVACTGFTAKRGPYANSIENRAFKRAILRKNSKTVIIAPAERVGHAVGQPVLETDKDWTRVLKENVCKIVTCPRIRNAGFTDVEKKLDMKFEVVEF